MYPKIVYQRNGSGYVAVWFDHLTIDFKSRTFRVQIDPRRLLETLKAGRVYSTPDSVLITRIMEPDPMAAIIFSFDLAAKVLLDQFYKALEEVQKGRKATAVTKR